VDDQTTPDRVMVAAALRAVAVGDRTDRDLPFAADRVFALAESVTVEMERQVVAALYDDTAVDADDAHGDVVALKWDRDAYRAGAQNADRYVGWLADHDPELSATAAELLAWFPATPNAVAG